MSSRSMHVFFNEAIRAGVSHQLLVDVTNIESPTNINYNAGADIALHISIRPKAGVVVVNKKLRSKWQKEFVLKIKAMNIASVGDFTITFLENEVSLVNTSCEPAEIRFPTNYSGVKEVRCLSGGRLVISPADLSEKSAKTRLAETGPSATVAKEKVNTAVTPSALMQELQNAKASSQVGGFSKLEELLRAHDPGAFDAETPALVCKLNQIISQPEFGKISVQSSAMLEAIFDACEAKARASMKLPIPILVHAATPDNYSATAGSAPELAPVVSLTCISSRIGRLVNTIETINQQDLRPQSINLYISADAHLIDKGISTDDVRLKVLHKMGVNIYLAPNIGPYRKQHYVISQLQNAKADPSAIIVTLDDDVLYPPDALSRLVSKCIGDECVVAQRGREMLISEGRVAPYKSFRETKSRKSHMNLANGRNGIAYQLRFFPQDHSLYVGPFLAPTADDLWCKWISAYYCIPTILLEPKAAFDPKFDFEDTDKLDKVSLFHSYNARGTNDLTIESLEAFFRSRLKSFYVLHGDTQ